MKRLFDVFTATVLLIVFAPLLIVLCVLQLCYIGRPLFFRQKRAGLHGAPFSIIKFRTMQNGPGDDAARLTAWGQFLRASSLDELPELIHVVSGKMSLVGPRPLPVHYLPRYSPEQARRHEVRPGITGWAQVNGRNALSWDAQFQADIWYVENTSLRLDLRILWLTLFKVLRRSDISAPGHATRGEFFGNNPAPHPTHLSSLQPVMNDDAILSLILDTVQKLAVDFDIPALQSPTTDSILFGNDGALDSMALVNLLADLEETIEAQTGAPIVLADERAMSAANSPFRTPATLLVAIRERLPAK